MRIAEAYELAKSCQSFGADCSAGVPAARSRACNETVREPQAGRPLLTVMTFVMLSNRAIALMVLAMIRTAMICMLALFVAGAISCSRERHEAGAPSTGQKAPANQEFIVKGVVKRLDASEKKAIIQHEEIPNYMAAMTMPFNVKNTDELKGIQPGDAVSFRLNVKGEESWIDQIKKTGVTQRNEPPTREAVRLVREVEPLNVGDQVPNYRFTNELGQAISLGDFRGKAVALTFIFTRCPIPDFCPLMSRKFAAVYKLLTADANAPTNWHLFSISFDPHFDTPPVLKRYAEQYKYDPQKWSFVSGAMIDIDAITEQFMVLVAKQGENWEHKLRTVVIDANGKVQKIFVYNQWTPEELVAELVKAAQAAPTGPQ